MKDAMYEKGGGGSKAGVHAAMSRNPNTHSEVNDTPVGPSSHCMGYTGDSGMKGDTSVKGKQGQSFNFK